MIRFNEVKIVDRPGYFGRRRREIMADYKKHFGIISESWQLGDLILSFREAVILYDQAYYEFLKNYQKIDYVISFSECFDYSKENIVCGTEHDEEASPRHIQDISVRRALLNMGIYFKSFRGWYPSIYQDDELLQIRGPDSNGYDLMPGKIPFHRPELISPIDQVTRFPKWANPNSVEAFWQANKVMVIPK